MNQIIESQKEMAYELRKSRVFIWAMQKKGFKLPATVEQAREFLKIHPHPTNGICNRNQAERRKKNRK